MRESRRYIVRSYHYFFGLVRSIFLLPLTRYSILGGVGTNEIIWWNRQHDGHPPAPRTMPRHFKAL